MNQSATESYALTPMQQGMLFQHLSSSEPGVNIEQIVCTLEEQLDLSVFRSAWESVVARHSVFRTSFRWDNLDQPIQSVHRSVELLWENCDWRRIGATEQQERFDELLRSDRIRGFDLGRAPLTRVTVCRLSDAVQRVVWTFHHIILDGRSFAAVLKEVFGFYEAGMREQALELDLPRSYRDHIEHLSRQDSSGAEAFWQRRLAGFATPIQLPVCGAIAEHTEPGLADAEVETRLSEATTTRLRNIAEKHQFTLNTMVQAAWAILLSRYSGQADVVFGATRACRRSSVDGADDMVGQFINTLPVRVRVNSETRLFEWLQQLRASQSEVWRYEQTPLAQVQTWSDVPAGEALFETNIVFDNYQLKTLLRGQGGAWLNREFKLIEKTGFPITVHGNVEPELLLAIAYDRKRCDDDTAKRMLRHLSTLLESMAADPNQRLSGLEMLTKQEKGTLLDEWNATETQFPRDACVHHLFEDQVRRTPDAVALAFEDSQLTYRELNSRANQLARHLIKLGAKPDTLVGVCVKRSVEMLVAILGIQKAGAAYLPLDPEFPTERLEFMLEDAKAPLLLTQAGLHDELPDTEARVIRLDADWPRIAEESDADPATQVTASNLAYVIYTSGSTGKPKGVMIEHRNVVNFFTGMDQRIKHDPPGVWLAVTSLSFDISVLELFWTLARGFKVVLYSAEHRQRPAAATTSESAGKPMDFSLFYFSSDEGERDADKYKLLLEGAKFADRNGFTAVSTPERHFHAFGGLYPNPSVVGATLAAITERVQIRAGSVVLPLHHPIRVAEEWALVDNLSGGRVGIAFASGWHPNDFVLAPHKHADRKKLLYEEIDVVRRLWRGESVAFPNASGESVEVRTLPRPIQPELPVWITTAGSIETYQSAGEIGANVLTHLLGQNVDEVAEKVQAYREARRQHGHSGRGHVILMLHTFVGEDDATVRAIVRRPMMNYLRSAMSLVKNFAREWTAYSKRAARTAEATGDELINLGDEDREALLEFAFERYYETSALFGTPQRCLDFIGRVAAAGVDEIACLIDFGVDADLVLRHLEQLKQVRDAAATGVTGVVANQDEYSISALVRRHDVTHLQCTPSMARMLLADIQTRKSLRSIQTMMVGGEALSGELAAELRNCVGGDVINMYGPTETTIWSSTHPASETKGVVPIGRPIANTQLYLLDDLARPVPIGVPGELYIGGEGVARGYHDRTDLTNERFLANPFVPGGRMYRTGDMARYREDGIVEFLGRSDRQVKIRGHRIELGEIESVLARHPSLRAAVVTARDGSNGDTSLLAYHIAEDGTSPSHDELTAFAERALPAYMVPDHFVRLSSFPLTPNGKVDYRALPAPGPIQRDSDDVGPAPQTPIEERIASIWSEILGADVIGADDNFFELGGNSLTTIQIISRIRHAFDVDLPLRALFETPTVKGIASAVEHRILAKTESAELSRILDEIESPAERRAGAPHGLDG